MGQATHTRSSLAGNNRGAPNVAAQQGHHSNTCSRVLQLCRSPPPFARKPRGQVGDRRGERRGEREWRSNGANANCRRVANKYLLQSAERNKMAGLIQRPPATQLHPPSSHTHRRALALKYRRGALIDPSYGFVVRRPSGLETA